MTRDFIQMWSEADEADAAIGGMDSVPAREWEDYNLSLIILLADDFKHGREDAKRRDSQSTW